MKQVINFKAQKEVWEKAQEKAFNERLESMGV